MPAIDDEKMNDLKAGKSLDIAKPPVKQIPFAEYPKAIYLHPKDKSKDHRSIVVNNKEEEDAARGKGYRLQPHVPVHPEPHVADIEDFEVDEPKAAKPPKEPKAAKQ